MRTYQIYLILFAVMIPWGLNVTATKLLVESFMPLTMTAFRIFTAGITVMLILLVIKKFRLPAKNEWKILTLGAVLNVAAHHSFLAVGLKGTTAINGGLILGISPLLTAILAIIFLGSRLTIIKLAGFMIGLSGVFITVMDGSAGLDGIRPGDIEVFLSILVQAFSFILIKKVSETMDPRLLTGYMMIIGSGMLFVLARIMEPEGMQSMAGGSPSLWLLFLLSAVIASALGHMMYNYCIGQIGAAEASIFLNLTPFFSLLGAALFLGEKITLVHLAGLLMIITGVIIGSGAYRQLFSRNRKMNASA
ncbi:DMT family transporter [Peribacillus sp. SCS-37]|uniref:DMT family transporter n=1 Tax=Paraperibacillus esterisolvens TaxID=3115296 RepID=UPI003905A46B